MEIERMIAEELDRIERQHGVRILHAAESGSRAWGFASPDSDYDVRFVYVHPARDYLRLDEPRDVIEWRLDDHLDINGWDLRKALRQFARGNATLYEWSGSPIVYRTTEQWARIREASRAWFSERAAVHHYIGMAASTQAAYLTQESVRCKKYFYALRPLLAARWIERYHAAPPVPFGDLLRLPLEAATREAIEALLARKKTASEGDAMPQVPALRDFIREELARQKELAAALPDAPAPDWPALNERFFEAVGWRAEG